MAIYVDTDLQMTVKCNAAAQMVQNVWSYNVFGAPGGVGVSATELANAWWNHVKVLYRAIVPVGFGAYFQSIECRVVNNPLGDFGEWPIPVGESVGTRANTAAPEFLPTFNAAGVKLTVATRATRPGQKRFTCLQEGDITGQALNASILTPLAAFMSAMVVDLSPLGAPAAAFGLRPKIFRLGAGEAVLGEQTIVGHLINPYVTSQVSRKQGRGI